jgi:spore germination protein GerM
MNAARARAATIAGITCVAALLTWLLFVGLPRWNARSRPKTAAAAQAAPVAPAPSGRKIKANLFYVADNGTHLVSVEREVPFGEGTTAQAQEIVKAQIAAATGPLVSAVPPGTSLRALFVTDRGDAFVDLSREFASGHTGGTTDEILTLSAIVQALTANLPAVKAVQVLIDGKEVDTLAGHVDLRHPLTKNSLSLQ